MNNDEDLSGFCCQAPQCPLQGRRGARNLSVCERFGKANHRLLDCNACKARFSEFKGTPYFNSKLPHDKVLAILAHLADGCGTRQTARLVGVNKDTVTRLALLAGNHAKAAHDELVAYSPATREVQFDEKWAFVGKKEANTDPDDPGDDHKGDYWDHVAFDPEHRLVLAVVPGARTIENACAIVAEAADRMGGVPPDLITTDEYPAYETAIREVFGVPVPAAEHRGPGRPRVAAERELPEGLVYATVHKEREGGRVVSVRTVQVFGTPAELDVERQNGTDRGRNARKSRKTYRFSKDDVLHKALTYLTMYSDNFCWAVRTLKERVAACGRWLKRTPAMAAGLADHVWTLREWFTRPAVQ